MSPLRELNHRRGEINIADLILPSKLPSELPKEHAVYTRTFDLKVENTGQWNIREFKLRVEFFTSPDSVPGNPSMVRELEFRDNEPDPRNKGKYNEEQPLPVNIYPGETFPVRSFRITSTSPNQYVLIKWTLYLPNQPHTSGQINLADEFTQDYDEEVPDNEDRVSPPPETRAY